MAGHVFGLTLKPYHQLDPDNDLECALEYIKAKGLSQSWIKNCRNSLVKFRRFLRLERGLGEESKTLRYRRPHPGAARLAGERTGTLSASPAAQLAHGYVDVNLRAFWNRYLHVWRFLCEERHVVQLADLKRLYLLDYIDQRLDEGRSSGVNADMRCLRSFLLFLQDEGYPVPQSLLRVPA